MTRSTGLPLTRIRGARPVTWTTILGLVLVPLTVAGLLVWGLWNPTERLDTVTAAVVNNDEPIELNGQTVPLGRLLAGELIGGGEDPEATGTGTGAAAAAADEDRTNFTWVLTDAEDAQAGLDDGRYATVVTIPKNFSEAATSASSAAGGGEADGASGSDAANVQTAKIDVAESDRGRLIDTALSSIVTQTATNLLNQQLGSQFVGGVFVGMNELGSGVGEAADGATKLADGGKKLADGASDLADGTEQLADGTQQLSDGASQLSSGVGRLSGGASDLAGGASQLATGSSTLASGARVFASGDGTPQNPGARGYAAGARLYVSGNGTAENPGLVTYLNGVEQYAAGIGGSLSEVRAGLTSGVDQMRAYRDGIANGTIQPPAGVDPQAMVAALDQALAAMQSQEAVQQLQQLDQQLGQFIAASDGIVQGARGYRDGAEGIAGGAERLATGAEGLATGAEGLAGGASQLSSGAAQLSSGTSELAAGASQLATGTSELAQNTPELAKGASQIADGAGKSADGAGELAKGLGDAVAQIPNYSETERDRLAEAAVAPVEAQGGSDELFNSSGVPLFAGIALWAGALASFLVLSPLWRRTREAAQGIGAITMRSALPAVLLGAVQGVIAGVVLPIALGYDLSQGARFFGLALLAGVAFALVVQGLAALLGGFGRFIAFALLVVAFAVGVVSTVPGPLAAIGDASPVGAALGGFQAIAAGASGSGLAAVVLVLWALGGLVLTALAVARARKA